MADKGSIHVETINSENHMILDCSNVDICGTLICANLKQTNPYYLNIGFNDASGTQNITNNTNFYPSLQLNTILYSSQYPSGDFPTSGSNAYFWTPSETGLYLVNVRLSFNSSSDELWEYNVKLVRHDINGSEVTWVAQSFRSDKNEEDFRYLSPAFSTLIRVDTVGASGERYRLKIKAKTTDNSLQLYMNPIGTCMEITKLG